MPAHSQHDHLPHHHHQHHHQNHQYSYHGHSETRGRPTTTVDVLYPYTPPSLEEHEARRSPDGTVSPEASSGSRSEHTGTGDSQQPQVMNVPVVFRDYQVLETHYSEVPLTSVDPETPPTEHYEARESLQGRPFQSSDGPGGTDISADSSHASDRSGSDSQENPNGDSKANQDDAERLGQSCSTEGLKQPDTDENANPTSKVMRFTNCTILHIIHQVQDKFITVFT